MSWAATAGALMYANRCSSTASRSASGRTTVGLVSAGVISGNDTADKKNQARAYPAPGRSKGAAPGIPFGDTWSHLQFCGRCRVENRRIWLKSNA